MSVAHPIEALRLVRIGQEPRARVEKASAAAGDGVVVARLTRLRERLEQDMAPEPWTDLRGPMVLLLADVCEALGLDAAERLAVLGTEGEQALTGLMETCLVVLPRAPMNERQEKALSYVRECGSINLGKYRQLCPNWSNETLRRDLVDLVARGWLVRSGAKKGTSYALSGSESGGRLGQRQGV